MVNAVKGNVPVLFDGGIRRGTDVFSVEKNALTAAYVLNNRLNIC